MKTIFEKLQPGAIGVKICGITNPGDADLSIEAGADALGLNFYPGSKRFIDLEAERSWLENLPQTVLRVAVVVNPTLNEALALLHEPFIDALQLHGDETVEFSSRVRDDSGKLVIKALRVATPESLAAVAEFRDFPVLLDAFAGAERGGTGHTFDWNWIENSQDREHLLLSGGLNPENISEALHFTKLRYVDVASGVETFPRQKNAVKVRSFVEAVRRFSSARS